MIQIRIGNRYIIFRFCINMENKIISYLANHRVWHTQYSYDFFYIIISWRESAIPIGLSPGAVPRLAWTMDGGGGGGGGGQPQSHCSQTKAALCRQCPFKSSAALVFFSNKFMMIISSVLT